MRHKPRVWMKHEIKRNNKEIGYLQLVDYMLGKNPVPHIEYHVNEEYRNHGVMTKELPKYLKLCKKRYKKYGDDGGTNRLIAIVENDNDISKKLLSANGFFKIKDFDNHSSYIAYLDLNIGDVEKMTNYFFKQRKEYAR